MLKNYLKVSGRNIIRHPFFSLVNISGLAFGITFLMLIGAFAYNEYSINKPLDQDNRVYLLTSQWKQDNMGYPFVTFGQLTKSLIQDYPTLIESAYVHDGITTIVEVGDKQFRTEIHPGDSTLFKVFDLPVLYGDKETALEKPNGVVLTAAKARLFFGTTNVVGKTIRIQSFDNNNKDFEITAVLKDLPFNTLTNYSNPSSEVFLAPASIDYFGRRGVFNWQFPGTIGYVKLKKGVKPAQLKEPLAQLLKTHTSADTQKNLKIVPVSFSDWYLTSDNGLAKKMILVFVLGGVFILIMAIINFVNITVGNSLTRIKEIGVRKAMGGLRSQLIIQFMAESLLLVSIALLVAIGFYVVVLPYFNQIVGKDLPAVWNLPKWFALAPLGIILVTGVLAGIYPSFVLSAQPSITALKGKLKTVQERQFIRRILIAVQFTTAIVVFITAIVINKQVSFFFQSNLGFNKDRIITVPVPRDWSASGVKNMMAKRD
ncbi:ABC transporter permease [Chitinophaga silvatica]|uniref:ABC transporter permease n=1 Tax=Chitinophaga silvatica TaxID=2282649 RepID=A0A3E1YBF1_9BACT|nr:ABC transporter permease [Chitinophaga silvatica]RFS23393.1 ABC transporter permease [Chitinophaga silvatica]